MTFRLERRRCEVARGVLAHQREARMDLLRPRQRRLDVGHDVVCADMVDEFGLMEELCRLVARATQDQCTAGFLQAIAQRFQRM